MQELLHSCRVCLRLTAGCFKCSVVSTSSPRLLNRASSTATYRENVSTTVRTRSFLLVASWSWRKSIAQTWFGPTASARSSAARVVQKLWSRNFFHKRAARGAPVLKPKAAPTVPPTSLISLRDRRIVLRGDRHEIGQDEILNRPVLDADMAHLGARHEAVIVLHPRPQPHRGEDALPEILRRALHGQRLRPTDRRNPHPHRPHEPLQRPRHRRDHPGGMTSAGKGEVTSQPLCATCITAPCARGFLE